MPAAALSPGVADSILRVDLETERMVKAWLIPPVLVLLGLTGCANQLGLPSAAAPVSLSAGAPGRIAFLSRHVDSGGALYRLNVVDPGQTKPKVIAQSRGLLMSPAWSPDGRQLAYVRFDHGQRDVVIQTVETGEVRLAAAEAGSPAWSPNGAKLAVAKTQNGNTDIHVLTLASGAMARVTTDPGIDTEPTWAPDGRHLAFTSDRGGKPQIYAVAVSNPQQVVRLIPEMQSAFEPHYSPDGKKLIYTAKNKAGYAIEMLNLVTHVGTPVSEGPSDESPSLSPDGRLVVYTAQRAGRSLLEVRALDGSVRQTLQDAGELMSASWSPMPEAAK